MSQTDESFETLQQSLESILPDRRSYDLRRSGHAIVLQTTADVAAFSVFNGHVQEEFDIAYSEFKALYREHHSDWDKRTLSFVLCRTSEKAEDDRFYAEREHDPLFCRKYVIHAHEDVGQQSQELLRLPFLPFPDDKALNLTRPQSARDLLQAAGVPVSLTRKLIEPGQRAPDGIVDDLLTGKESLPDVLRRRPDSAGISPVKPRAVSRLTEATVESFRAYSKPQQFNLDASVVVLYGPNGLGKTSFFDAIDYACTGRIGRLCRQRKFNQEDFSRVATYLDDTAGTGSVVVHGHSRQGDAEPSPWSLRRGTGNWSTAWIDDKKTDRTSTLTFLTNAEWGEIRPRQQNVESLFRATHLFGQDEQEFLAEFRKSSMLPESFVSEMLALQDYAQGLSKVKAVSQSLGSKKGAFQDELTSLEAEQKLLTESISKLDESHTQESIEQLAVDIRKQVNKSRLDVRFPDEPVTVHELANWLDLVSAQANAFEQRLKGARAIRNDIPVFHRAKEQRTSHQAALASLDSEIKSIADERTAIKDQQAVASRQATTQKSGQIELDRRRRELEAVRKWFDARPDHEGRLEHARSGKKSASKEIATGEATLSNLDAESKSALSDRNRWLQSSHSLESMLRVLVSVTEGFPKHIVSVQKLTKLKQDLEGVSKQQIDLGDRLTTLRERVLAAEAECKKLAPDFERVKSQQAELETLLDAVQSHLAGSDCPLCGTDFKSHESLLDHVNQHRRQQSAASTIASRYAQLKSAEAKAQDELMKATAEEEALKRASSELALRRKEIEVSTAQFLATANACFLEEMPTVDQSALEARRESIQSELGKTQKQIDQAGQRITELKAQRESTFHQHSKLLERAYHLASTCTSLEEELMQEDARASDVLAAEQITDSAVETTITTVQDLVRQSLQTQEELRRTDEQLGARIEDFEVRTLDAMKRRETLHDALEKAQTLEGSLGSRLSELQLPAESMEADNVIADLETAVNVLRKLISDARVLLSALTGMQSRQKNDLTKKQIEALNAKATQVAQRLAATESNLACCKSIESLLSRERQSSVENHIAAYGPLISNIQQRLRSVYGFGGVHLEARGGEAAVNVEWRNKDAHLKPTDFFSDSQKQILMLSVFLAGGLRQNWSGFAPVLLDDPVTHFDDLNAYGFVELIRGIISSQPNEWQFIISTCEDRLFTLMQKKFARLPGGAIFYEFLGMSDSGPIVERR